MTSYSDKIMQQRRWWDKLWLLLLAAGYVALIPVLAGLEDVQGVTYLLGASAVACLLVWFVRYPPGSQGFLGAIKDWRFGRQHGHRELPDSQPASLPAPQAPPRSRWVSLLAPLNLGIEALRGLPAVVLWLPLPISLSWTAGMMARVHPLHAPHYYLAFALWLSALILFVAIFFVPLVVENWGKLPRLVRAIPWPEVAAVAVITAVAFAVRFILLASEPGPFWQDEGQFASGGLEVARGIRSNFFFIHHAFFSNLYHLTMGLPFKLFGPSVLWARLPHAIVGTITVPLLYLMLREMFDRRVALVGAAFLAVYHYHVHFSRLALPNIYDTFFGVLVMLFAFRAIRSQKLLDFALAGLAAGLSLYFFSGGRMLPLMLVILLGYMALKTRGAFVLRNFWGLGTLAAGFVISSLPAALFWDGNPGNFRSRWEQMNIFDSGFLERMQEHTGRSELHVLWDQFQQSLGILVVYDDVFLHYNAGIPLLTGISSVFFVIGGVYALFHIFQPRFFALFTLLLLIVIFLGTFLGPPVAEQRYLGTVPISAAFVALGVVVAAEAGVKVIQWIAVEAGVKVIPRWRSYAPAAMAVGVLLIGFVNLSFYFGTYLPSDNFGLGRHLAAAQVADYLEAFDDSYTVYFFTSPGLPRRDQGLLFRNWDKIFVDVVPEGVLGPTFVESRRYVIGEAGEAAREARPNALFLVPTARSAELVEIVDTCPNGVTSDVLTTPNGAISYAWYEVLGAQACVDRLQLDGILKEL